MNLFRMLQQRAADHKPLRVGLIGAGKFGSMYLAQARHTPGHPCRRHRRPRAGARRGGVGAHRAGSRRAYGATVLRDGAAQHGTTYLTDDAWR